MKVPEALTVPHIDDHDFRRSQEPHRRPPEAGAAAHVARLLARLLYGSPWLRRVVFSRLGQPLCERMTDVVCGELSYRELLGSPARYFRAARRLVTVPPAYPKG